MTSCKTALGERPRGGPSGAFCFRRLDHNADRARTDGGYEQPSRALVPQWLWRDHCWMRILRRVALVVSILLAASGIQAGASEVIPCYLDAVDFGSTPAGDGYWVLHEHGDAQTFGGATSYGGPQQSGYELSGVAVAFASTSSGNGDWTATADGGVFAHGDAVFLGSAAALALNKPIVDLEPAPDGRGYWLLAADGGVFSFGSARFAGSATDATTVDFVAMEATASGDGYWLARADGAVFPFGGADTRLGPASTIRNLRAPIVDMAATHDRTGLRLAAADGGVFTYGAAFHGSAADTSLNEPITAIGATSDDGGYWLLAEDGGVFTFGNARFHGASPHPSEDPRCG